MDIDLIIFDCDGVLVDSELIGNRIMAQYLASEGWSLSLAEVMARFKGRATSEIWSIVEEHLGRALSPGHEATFRSAQLAALRDEVEVVKGIPQLLRSLQCKFCVASNGPHEKMAVTLAATGLWAEVEGRVFSRTDVPRPKPYPDLFLHAAATLGVSPSKCLVVEDSPLGVRAATRAGMRAFGFAGTSGAEEQALRSAGCEEVFSTMSSLGAALARWGLVSKALGTHP